MIKPSDFELWYCLYSLEVEHWYDVNMNDGKTVHDLYAEDGILMVGQTEHRGRSVIRNFYQARAKRGVRTARHMVTNFQIRERDHEGHCRATGIVSLFAGDAPPLLESKPAMLIADLLNDYVKSDDGQWCYQSHILRPIFVGDDPFVKAALK